CRPLPPVPSPPPPAAPRLSPSGRCRSRSRPCSSWQAARSSPARPTRSRSSTWLARCSAPDSGSATSPVRSRSRAPSYSSCPASPQSAPSNSAASCSGRSSRTCSWCTRRRLRPPPYCSSSRPWCTPAAASSRASPGSA
ncbi:MAG: hypothetical protein AVDCRST_MAG11-3478, partial [uncultured Gemmatimonadaceae bacterium]